MLNPPYDKYSKPIGIYHVVLNKQEKFSACAESSLNEPCKKGCIFNGLKYIIFNKID